MTRTCRRSMRAAAAAALAPLVAVGTLWAHTALLRSEPAKDDRLAAPPRLVRLEFSEAVDPATSRIALVAPDESRLDLAPRRAAGGDARHLDADVPPLEVAGRYRLEWRLIGPDGHPVSGTYSFTVDSIPAPAAQPPAAPGTAGPASTADPGSGGIFAPDSTFGVLVRLLSTIALLLVIGSGVVALRLVPRVGTWIEVTAAGARLAHLARGGAWLLAAILAARMVTQVAWLAGSPRDATLGDVETILLATWWGAGWTLQVIGAAGLLLLTGGGRVARMTAARWRLVALAGLVLALGASGMGHPAAAANAPVIAMGLDALHALAAGGWVGALTALVIVVLPAALALPEGDRLPAVRATLQGFSPIALTAAGLLVVTGLIGAWWQLGSIAALTGSPYGRVLIGKLGAVCLVALVGAYHWRVVQPALHAGQPLSRVRSTVRMEVALMFLVVVLTAVLTGTATPIPSH